MQTRLKKAAGWGNYPTISGQITYPNNRLEVLTYLQTHLPCIASGQGRSYGDAALAPRMMATHHLRSIVHFDGATGVITCESGVRFAEILAFSVPLGWTIPVLPGTKLISVGGAIAANIHGKNQLGAHLFSDILLEFELADANGNVLVCNRNTHTDLFWNTVGGMGRTGIVLQASFQLQPIRTVWLRQETIATQGIEPLLAALQNNNSNTYAAAWLHPTLLRGYVFMARMDDSTDLNYRAARPINVPFFLPNWLLNRYTMQWYNRWYMWRQKTGTSTVHFDRYFFPLDGIGQWNKLYGKRGFVQYQVCFATACAAVAFEAILAQFRQMDITPFLVVIKQHPAPPPEIVHTFLQQGFSMAIDLPYSTKVPDLIERLDQITAQWNGKVYAAKDALSSANVVGLKHPMLNSDAFVSLQKLRYLRSKLK